MCIKEFGERINGLDKHIEEGYLTDNDAKFIIELLLDILIEVGNGVTDETLHWGCDYLLKFRDLWFENKIKGDI